MRSLLVPLVVVLAALAVAAALWTPDNNHPQTPPTTTAVVRGQANESSRLEPGWRLPNGHCTFTSPELAETVGGVRDKACDR